MITKPKTQVETQVAAYLWRQVKTNTTFYGSCGEIIVVNSLGESDNVNSLEFFGASITINDTAKQGTVLVGKRDFSLANDNVILQVVANQSTLNICKSNGEMVPQLIMPIRQEVLSLVDDLVSSSKSPERCCANFINELDPFTRMHIMTALLYERLETKYNEVLEVHAQSDYNWNQTMHVMLFRAMGSPKNTQPFKALAQRIPYNIISHERDSIEMLEALLYGGSGLLQTRSDRYNYIKTLRLHFSHLSTKYDIMPLKAGVWSLNSSNFNGKPVTRLMQTAFFLKNNPLLFDKVINTNDVKEIYDLFAGETSTFWRDEPDMPLKIGKDRQEMLAINLMVPIKFAHAKSVQDELMQENAIEMLYKIPLESNGIISSWKKAGLKLATSADSQSMIQLTNVYCSQQKCTECRFGKEQIKQKLADLSK